MAPPFFSCGSFCSASLMHFTDNHLPGPLCLFLSGILLFLPGVLQFSSRNTFIFLPGILLFLPGIAEPDLKLSVVKGPPA